MLRAGNYYGVIYDSPYSDRRREIGRYEPNRYIVAVQPTIINQLTVVVNIPPRATQLADPTVEQARAASQQAGIAIGAQPTSTEIRTAPVVPGEPATRAVSVLFCFRSWCVLCQ